MPLSFSSHTAISIIEGGKVPSHMVICYYGYHASWTNLVKCQTLQSHRHTTVYHLWSSRDAVKVVYVCDAIQYNEVGLLFTV